MRKGEGIALIRNEQILLPLGGFCLVGAILLGRFAEGVSHVAFIEGLLLGVSLVFNLAYLIRLRSKRGR